MWEVRWIDVPQPGRCIFTVYVHETFIRTLLVWGLFRVLSSLPFIDILHESMDEQGDHIIDTMMGYNQIPIRLINGVFHLVLCPLTFSRIWKTKVDV